MPAASTVGLLRFLCDLSSIHLPDDPTFLMPASHTFRRGAAFSCISPDQDRSSTFTDFDMPTDTIKIQMLCRVALLLLDDISVYGHYYACLLALEEIGRRVSLFWPIAFQVAIQPAVSQVIILLFVPMASTTTTASPAATSSFSVDIGSGISISTAEIVGLGVAVTVAIIIFVIALLVLFWGCSCRRKRNRRSLILYDDEKGTYPGHISSATTSEISQLPPSYHPPSRPLSTDEFDEKPLPPSYGLEKRTSSTEKVRSSMLERASSSRSEGELGVSILKSHFNETTNVIRECELSHLFAASSFPTFSLSSWSWRSVRALADDTRQFTTFNTKNTNGSVDARHVDPSRCWWIVFCQVAWYSMPTAARDHMIKLTTAWIGHSTSFDIAKMVVTACRDEIPRWEQEANLCMYSETFDTGERNDWFVRIGKEVSMTGRPCQLRCIMEIGRDIFKTKPGRLGTLMKRSKHGLGRWNFYGAVYGPPLIQEAMLGVIKNSFLQVPGSKFHFPQDVPNNIVAQVRYNTLQRIPSISGLTWVDWIRSRKHDLVGLPNGSHGEFSPIAPVAGKDAKKQYVTRRLNNKYGFDFIGTFIVGTRSRSSQRWIILLSRRPPSSPSCCWCRTCGTASALACSGSGIHRALIQIEGETFTPSAFKLLQSFQGLCEDAGMGLRYDVTLSLSNLRS
ncbi:uncharacterized protein MYCFIDRAFT_171504 [Pseudocercospora fijiensis CIRAD86]|uniref:Uncharacterized protein n=1 Tax=Pseudocercospora fijiensis (strain CIRAD86) TaxID=383855 RepID=M2Z741_PSEFD|nr:uncharacterized protein MYCFIDRAFT_171504 [Pseudocercospora fijiensis CIRAD86]EME85605.1 hypothetical protein MYCFIDRAFT_171504 [Pseudocercospora fijiensis CIRAD86]